MGYDITTRLLNARASADWAAAEDGRRLEFLRKLDAAPFEVTDWEAQFIQGFMDGPRARSLTPRQRDCVEALRRKYGGRL